MFEKYIKFFNRDLDTVKRVAQTDPKTCVQLCDMYQGELMGILSFLYELDKIGYELWSSERDRVMESFDSIAVCGMYQIPGKIQSCHHGRNTAGLKVM